MKITRNELKGLIREELSKHTFIKEASHRKNVTAMGVDFEVIDQDGDLFWKFKNKEKAVERVKALGGLTNFAKKIQASLDYSYGKGQYVLRSGESVEQTGGLLFMKKKETDLSKLKIESKALNEADFIHFTKLKPEQQKQVKEFEKFFGGKHQTIWDGIHGNIVAIKVPTGRNRLEPRDLKSLSAMKLRWIEFDGQIALIGF